jgi:hydrogenase-4 component E
MGIATGAGGLVVTLMVIHLLASMIVAEMKNLRGAVYALVVQSLTLCFVILLLGWGQGWMVAWFFWALATKVFFLPWLFLRTMRAFPQREEAPIAGGWVSFAVVAASVLVIYQLLHTYLATLVPTVAAAAEPTRSSLAMAFTIFVLGIYVCVSRRDLVKVIIGVVLLENGAHLALISLVPARAETAILGIVTNVVLSAWLLLYFGTVMIKVLGTTDTLKLSELRR